MAKTVTEVKPVKYKLPSLTTTPDQYSQTLEALAKNNTPASQTQTGETRTMGSASTPTTTLGTGASGTISLANANSANASELGAVAAQGGFGKGLSGIQSWYQNQVNAAANDAESRYANLKEQYNAGVDKQLEAQIGSANKSADQQLREAYVTKLQNENALNDRLARSGIRGGATETANLNLANAYGNSRNSIYSNRDQLIQQYNLAADQNKLTYGLDVDTQYAQYLQNLGAEARQAGREDRITQAQWDRDDELTQRQWEREDALTKKQWQREDKVRQIEYKREDKLRAEDLKNTANQTYWEGKAKSFQTADGVKEAIKNLKKKLKQGKIAKKNYKLAVGLLNSRLDELKVRELNNK